MSTKLRVEVHLTRGEIKTLERVLQRAADLSSDPSVRKPCDIAVRALSSARASNEPVPPDEES